MVSVVSHHAIPFSEAVTAAALYCVRARLAVSRPYIAVVAGWPCLPPAAAPLGAASCVDTGGNRWCSPPVPRCGEVSYRSPTSWPFGRGDAAHLLMVLREKLLSAVPSRSAEGVGMTPVRKCCSQR